VNTGHLSRHLGNISYFSGCERIAHVLDNSCSISVEKTLNLSVDTCEKTKSNSIPTDYTRLERCNPHQITQGFPHAFFASFQN
jgi:hypothetical protein